jgi:hypothetical protein
VGLGTKSKASSLGRIQYFTEIYILCNENFQLRFAKLYVESDFL